MSPFDLPDGWSGVPHLTSRTGLLIAAYVTDRDGKPCPYPPPALPFVIDRELLCEIRNNRGETMVEIHPDGRVVLTEHYDPDETARRFWGSIAYCAEQNLHSERLRLARERPAILERPERDD